MASVIDFASVLREDDVKALCVEFDITKEIVWRVPGKKDRAYAPLEGHITVNEVHLRSGLRLPLLEELESIMKALRVPIAQLHANAVRYLCTMCIFARKLGQKFKMSGVRVLFKESGQVPEAYFGTPSAAEWAANEWLLKVIKENLDDFIRDFLASREETRKANWGPPSPVKKPMPPVRMTNSEDSKGILIRMRPTDEGFISPLPKKVLETPSSSLFFIDYMAARICGRASSTTGLKKTESVAATLACVVEPVGLNPPKSCPEAAREEPVAATPEVAREEPAAAAPEHAREEPAAAMGETDAFIDHILDEAAASLAREDAPGPPPTGPGLESRPVRPSRKIYESRRLILAYSRKVEQRDHIIADREAEIAWLDARLAASGGEHCEQTIVLEAGMEAENAELKVEVARLKEEEDRSKASKKRLADRISTLENELGLRIRPHELEGMLHARMFEGFSLGVCHRSVDQLDAKAGAILSEALPGELGFIVGHNDLGDAEPIDDVLAEEFQGIVFCYLSRWDSFDPLGEVVDAYDDEFPLPRGNGKQAKEIEPPLREGPRGLKGLQICE
ncbi:hypothetical protein Nepgr_029898 [Nepenthes gracilis]|uniref:Uncharacterized protein n=1 Tax=Nepenthes gracilis TaxID=150966 RepID=A0AAD3TDI7_NEPGR|nr:hypothetical protein Nepgr_029898 [Nepenthes gracilis]